MLWRVRTTLPDRPGTLAVLADHCGKADVNILGLQVFPAIDRVTDELVLRTPEGWGLPEIAAVVEAAGGAEVSVVPCTEQALVDQPTRHILAARSILAQPAGFPEVAARLFDAEADPVEDRLVTVQDVMDMQVGDVQVQVRRTAPFTAIERARGAALADLVTDVLARARADASPLHPVPSRRVGTGTTPEYAVSGQAVEARVAGTVVGLALLRSATSGEPDPVSEATLRVDPAWQRRGIGTRLLRELAILAAARGVGELVLHTGADNQAVLPLVLAAQLRGRIRMSGDVLTVRIPVHRLAPQRG